MTHADNPAVSPPHTWRRKLLIRAGLVLLLITPLLIANAYMWSMWDPSHYIRDVKMALVNEDKGTQQNGQEVSFGKDVVKGLIDTEYLNLEEVDANQAEEGLRDGTYMATISIPEDFSKKVASVIDPKPQQANVIIGYNDHYGTNTPFLTSGLMAGIQQGIQKGISEGYGAQILDGMNQLGGGLKEAADGAKQLDDGMAQLKDGTEQGIDGVIQLKDGTAQIRDGAAQLDDGMAQLQDGTGQLGDGAAQIDDGVGQLTGMLIPLLRQAGGVADGLRPVINALEQAGLHAQAQQIRDNISMLDNSNPEALANQLQKLKDGTAEMRYNLTDPSAPYLSGVIQLKDGTSQLRTGSVQLDDGMAQMKDGTYQLDDGARQLKDGTAQLNTGLSEGAKQAPEIKDIKTSSTQIAVPVSYTQDYRHPVQTLQDLADPTSKKPDAGVTLIMVLVFGFLMMAVISMIAPHVLGKKRRLHIAGPILSGFALVGAINLVALLVLTLFSKLCGFNIPHFSYWILLILLAANGTATFQMFRVVFGRLVGAIVALGYYGYGVLCFGGVWPYQMTPGPLKVLNHIHPMSYALDAYSGSVDKNFNSSFVVGVLVLIVTTILFLGISIAVRSIQLKKLAKVEAGESTDVPMGDMNARA
ncbi:YhgE/Pip family protein [Corynebacterium uropygiale]|uniref:YhgE/Pip family protein n=1 Tax=Corynebacterium uropygiale TaxID=1775911 RepID=A0A9X1U016_9CORY|nr:YhgE/Pip family protein [Corynebacterium uropygiale]MCF4007536.1 YhgE/Pip family protein [Corynebacterium uropygiale]